MKKLTVPHSLPIILLSFIFILFSNTAKGNSLDSLLSTLPVEKNENHVDQLFLIADACNTLDSFVFYLKQAITISEQVNYQEGLLKGNYLLGKKYSRRGSREKSLPFLEKAIELGKQMGDDVTTIKALKSKGASLSDMGKFIDAQQILLQGLTLANRSGDSDLQARLNFSLGELHRKQHNVSKAVEYYDKAGAIHKAKGEERDLCRIKYSKAITYKISANDSLTQKGVEILEHLLQSSCATPGKANRPDAITHTSLGSMYIFLGKYELSKEHLLKGLAMKKILRDSASMAYSYNELSTLYNAIGQPKEAIKFGETAFQIMKNKQDLMVSYDILRRLAFAHEEAGSFKKAYGYLIDAFELKDSVNNRQKAEILVEMETKYESSQKEEKIITQNLEIALQKNQFDRLLLITLLLISSIGGVSLWYYFRFQNKTIEANKSQELEQLKSRFLANISHEFRTPLSLIIGPLKKIMEPYAVKNNQDSTIFPATIEAPTADLNLVVKNAARLQQLIGQLLDLSQLEINQSKLNLQNTNLSNLVENIVNNFQSQANIRRIELEFDDSDEEMYGLFDEEKINVILMNLLSNAFKFTKDNGSIKVGLSINEKWVRISVKDNGQGIEAQNLPKIFTRFYQVDNSTTRAYEGSGIGLALTKELIDIHKGKIEVKSTLGEGSVFNVFLPYKKGSFELRENKTDALISRRDLPVEDIHAKALFIPNQEEKNQGDLNSHKILVIEDNEDMRKFLVSYLQDDFLILEAPDGKIGLQLAKKHLPDLILSDVMMPGTDSDGFTLCKAVKEELLTSHIPVVLLTAKADQEDILLGLEYQADDYITKPFEPKILKSKIHNLIHQRKKLRILFAESVQILPTEMSMSSKDEIFIKEFMEIIETNISNENFGVNELGQALKMNRTQLYRKVKALTGKPVSNLIKNIRLQRSRHLLEQKIGNVSEVANMVGYRNPEYFSQVFKKEFGINPTEFLKKKPNPNSQE